MCGAGASARTYRRLGARVTAALHVLTLATVVLLLARRRPLGAALWRAVDRLCAPEPPRVVVARNVRVLREGER